MTRRKILILNADTDRAENLDNNLSTYLFGLIFDSESGQRNMSVVSYNVYNNNFPNSEDFDGAMITGSSTNVLSGRSDSAPWVNNLISYVSELNQRDVPLLGICFGHQVLAIANGGRVDPIRDDMPRYELGYREVNLTQEGTRSRLFSGFPMSFYVNESHRNRVVGLPENGILLATNDYGIQSFEMGNSVGIQFHPEIHLSPAIRSLERRISDPSNPIYRDQFEAARTNIEREYQNTNGNFATRVIDNFITNYVR